jgi:hypothetical protein
MTVLPVFFYMKNVPFRVQSTILLSTLLIGACKMGSSKPLCPDIPGIEVAVIGYGQVDENGDPTSIMLERVANVIPTGAYHYNVYVGQNFYKADDGRVNEYVWEYMTREGIERLADPYDKYAQYGYSVEHSYPEHIYACLQQNGRVLLPQETFITADSKQVKKDWLKADIEQSIYKTEQNKDMQGWQGVGERRRG